MQDNFTHFAGVWFLLQDSTAWQCFWGKHKLSEVNSEPNV